MIMDKEVLFADNLPVDGTPTDIDTGILRPGPGKDLRIFVSVSPETTGMTGVSLQDSADGSSFEALTTITENTAGQLLEFTVPSNARRWLRLNLAGTVANGTWTAGIVLPGSQTNT